MHLEDGEEPPDICIPPPLNQALARFVTAFNLLSGDRPQGFGIGPIPTGAVITYARDIEGETEREGLKRFLRFVRALDDEFLKAQRQSEKTDGD